MKKIIMEKNNLNSLLLNKKFKKKYVIYIEK